MWRFKTEEEFIKDFGPNWREYVACRWDLEGNMDYLFGKIISPDKLDKKGKPKLILGYGCTIENFGIGTEKDFTLWHISREMLKFDRRKHGINQYEIY
jgi:hypothetical protein